MPVEPGDERPCGENPSRGPNSTAVVTGAAFEYSGRVTDSERTTLASLLDKRLLLTFGLLGVVGFVACDGVNAVVNRAFADPALPAPKPESWKPGTTHQVELTLITKDYTRLDCAADEVRDGTYCKYLADHSRRPKAPDAPLDDNNEHLVQPYRTAVGNHFLMVAGLWATPDVAQRVHDEPFSSVPEKKLKRFVADCRVRFVEPLAKADVRWGSGQKWISEKSVSVGIAEECRIVR